MFDGLVRFRQTSSECMACRSRDYWKKKIRLFA